MTLPQVRDTLIGAADDLRHAREAYSAAFSDIAVVADQLRDAMVAMKPQIDGVRARLRELAVRTEALGEAAEATEFTRRKLDAADKGIAARFHDDLAELSALIVESELRFDLRGPHGVGIAHALDTIEVSIEVLRAASEHVGSDSTAIRAKAENVSRRLDEAIRTTSDDIDEITTA